MCQAPLVFAEILAISNFELVIVFRLVATLCENGGTLNVMVKLEDIFVPLTIAHLVFKANRMEVSKVQLESWHVVVVWPNFITF